MSKSHLEKDLEAISKQVWSLAAEYQDDVLLLLFLLRHLEELHGRISKEMFEPALPDNRQALYNLLREIEETGGWPYIERPRLQKLLANWQQEDKRLNLEKENSAIQKRQNE